jgi:uncharacterized alkaline shock family protein YloU
MVDDNARTESTPVIDSGADAQTEPVGEISKNSPETARAQQAAAQDATGRTTISDIAVAKVAGIAARKVEGVFALGSGTSRALGALRDAVGSSDLAQGVHVEVGETQVAVDINLVASYGNPLQGVASQVRAAVYTAVQALVGLDVIEVNVEINDVHVPGVNDGRQGTN